MLLSLRPSEVAGGREGGLLMCDWGISLVNYKITTLFRQIVKISTSMF